MAASNAFFAFVLTLSVGFFALNVQRLVRYMSLGVSENRTDNPFERLKRDTDAHVGFAHMLADCIDRGLDQRLRSCCDRRHQAATEQARKLVGDWPNRRPNVLVKLALLR